MTCTYHLFIDVRFIEQNDQISLSALDHLPELLAIALHGDLRYDVRVLLAIALVGRTEQRRWE